MLEWKAILNPEHKIKTDCFLPLAPFLERNYYYSLIKFQNWLPAGFGIILDAKSKGNKKEKRYIPNKGLMWVRIFPKERKIQE